MRLVVQGVEEDGLARVRMEDGRTLEMPRQWLPEALAVGDQLRMVGGKRGEFRFAPDTPDLTQRLTELPPAHLDLLRRLAVLEGGWTLEAAQAVAQPEGLGLSLETALNGFEGRNLVFSLEAGPRYQMGHAARRRLLDSPLGLEDLDPTRLRHAGYFLQVAERLEARPDSPQAVEQLQLEEANFRAASRWAYQNASLRSEIAQLGVRLSGTLFLVWWRLQQWAQGGEWLEISRELAERGGLAQGPRLLELAGGVQGDLSHREGQVLRLIADGLSNKRIAKALAISTHTVKFYTTSLFNKLEAANRAQLVANAVRLRLL